MTSPAWIVTALVAAATVASDATLPTPGVETGVLPADARFRATLGDIEGERSRLAQRWRSAETAAARAGVRNEARRYVVATLVRKIFPAWYGTPWHMGEDDDASVPHQPGKRVSCSYFVTAALLNVGLKLTDRRAFAQSPALHIQRSLAPAPEDLSRFPSVPAATFARAVSRLGDGLYVVGLNCHVGFIHVEGGEASFIHSNYVDPEVGVTREPVATSAAIANSEAVGYWVTPLFQDDRLIEQWLDGRAVPLQRLGNVRKPFAATR
jgi:hypothetical protein